MVVVVLLMLMLRDGRGGGEDPRREGVREGVRCEDVKRGRYVAR